MHSRLVGSLLVTVKWAAEIHSFRSPFEMLLLGNGLRESVQESSIVCVFPYWTRWCHLQLLFLEPHHLERLPPDAVTWEISFPQIDFPSSTWHTLHLTPTWRLFSAPSTHWGQVLVYCFPSIKSVFIPQKILRLNITRGVVFPPLSCLPILYAPLNCHITLMGSPSVTPSALHWSRSGGWSGVNESDGTFWINFQFSIFIDRNKSLLFIGCGRVLFSSTKLGLSWIIQSVQTQSLVCL